MPGRNAQGRHDWTAEVARAHADAIKTGRRVERFAWEHGPGVGFPALRRRQLTAPTELDTLPAALGAHSFSWIVEAVPSLISAHAHPIALDPGGDLAGWRDLAWFDARTGEELQLTTDLGHVDEHDERVVVVAEPLREKALDWARPRPWPLPEMIVVDPLLVRSIGRAGHRFLTGYADVVDHDLDAAAVLAHVARAQGASWLADVARISERSARRFADGAHRSDAIARALRGLRASGLTLPGLLDLAAQSDHGTCALDGCTAPVRRGGARCPAHREVWDRQRRRLTERKRRQLVGEARAGEGSVVCGELGCDAQIIGSAAAAVALRRGWTMVKATWCCEVHAPRPPTPVCARCGDAPAAVGSLFCARCARARPEVRR
jgi:hypothetical protein